MTAKIVLLDDVDVRLVQYVGSDATIIAAAKVSTTGEASLEFLTQDAREGLLRYLMNNRHGTPFEHTSMTFFIKAPIFVFREFHRHRIGWSYNEESARYKQLTPEFYIPSFYRPGLMQVEGGRPGQYSYLDATMDEHISIVARLIEVYQAAYDQYEQMIVDGVAKEVARMCLPTAIYSSMYATCNPRSLMAFLSLRTKREQWNAWREDGNEGRAKFPSKPMWEINRAADYMELEFGRLFPLVHRLYQENGRVAP